MNIKSLKRSVTPLKNRNSFSKIAVPHRQVKSISEAIRVELKVPPSSQRLKSEPKTHLLGCSPIKPSKLTQEGKGMRQFLVRLKRNLSKQEEERYVLSKSKIHRGKSLRITPSVPEIQNSSYMYSICSLKGYNTNKPNQDLPFAISFSKKNLMVAVCDGHGAKGHLVSARVHQCFKKILEKFNTTAKQFDRNHKQIINKFFLQVTQMLEAQTDLDISLSGCTCVAAFFNADRLYVANIGDSRAVLVELVEQNLSMRSMNIQHKPQLPSQMLRINRMGGKISQSIYNSYEGILRFYNKVQQGPGLALTRAFGDTLFKSSGLISIPDIICHNIQTQDLVLILGSDGLFDQLVEHQILSVVRANLSQEWAQRLCRKSMFKCREKGMQSSDDISCVTVQLHRPSNK